MLQESLSGGEDGSSKSAPLNRNPPTARTGASAIPTPSTLAGQLAIVAKAAHSYDDQLLELTQGWNLSLRALDEAWNEGKRAREKGKGRKLQVGGGEKYLGPAMNDPAIWDALPLLARFVVGLPTTLSQLRASDFVSDEFAERIILTLGTRAASSTKPLAHHAPLAVSNYSSHLSTLSIPPWPICPIKVLLYFVSRLPERCNAHLRLAVLTPQISHNPFTSSRNMNEVRGRLAAAQKLTEDLWDVLEPPVKMRGPSVLNEILEAAQKAGSFNAGKRRASDQVEDEDEDEDDDEPDPKPPSPRQTHLPTPLASSFNRVHPPPRLSQPSSRQHTSLPKLTARREASSPPAPPLVRYDDLSEDEAELEMAKARLRDELFVELNPGDWNDMFEEEEEEEPKPTLARPVPPPTAHRSSSHTFQPPSPPSLPLIRQPPALPTKVLSEGRRKSGEEGRMPRRKRRKVVVKSFEEFYADYMRRT